MRSTPPACRYRRRSSNSHRPRAGAALEAPADDPLRPDADQRRRELDRLAATADLDAARVPRVGAPEIVDHDRRPSRARYVAELLRALELVAADLDRVARRVVDPSDGHDVRRAVGAHGGDPAELAPARHVLALRCR